MCAFLLRVCLRAYVYVGAYVCVSVCACVFTCVYVCVCVHIFAASISSHTLLRMKSSLPFFACPIHLAFCHWKMRFFLCEEKKSRVHMVCEHPNTNTSFHMSIISWISLLSHALGKAFEPQRKLLMIKPK